MSVNSLKDGTDHSAADAFAQPLITGTGSSQKFQNPWPEWQVPVCPRVALLAFSWWS